MIMKKKILSTAFCAIMICMLAVILPNSIKVQAGVYDPYTYQETLKPGETSREYRPAMRDTFKSYSNTDSSVADIQYTDPTCIYIVAKNPGKTVITIYAEWIDFIINVTVEPAVNPSWDTTNFYNGYCTVREGDTTVATLNDYTSDCVFTVGGGNADCVEITDHKNGTVSIKGLKECNGGVYLYATNNSGYSVGIPLDVVAAEPTIRVPKIYMKYEVEFPLNGGTNPPIIGNVYNIKSIDSYHKMLSVYEVNGVFYANPQWKGDFTLYIETFTGKTLTVPVNVS